MAPLHEGFPHKGLPTGWFQVCWSAELAVGDVKPLRYFARDLVAFRTESGVAQVLDAHCPHMGAHIGHGGFVEGEDVVCPFHGWSWSRAGQNTMVPSVGKPITRRSLGCWTTHESNGIVWVWHDLAGRAPLWPGPEDQSGVREGERFDVWPHCMHKYPNVRMKPQYVSENNVDIDHLTWVHKAQGPVILENMRVDEWSFHTDISIVYGYGKERTRLTPDGPVTVVVPAHIWGVGYQFTHFPLPDEAISIQAQTPIDEDHCDMFQTVLVYRGDAPADSAPEGIAAARVYEQIVQIERDVPIWENMVYRPNAALTAAEAKPVGAMRKWAARFYPADSDSS